MKFMKLLCVAVVVCTQVACKDKPAPVVESVPSLDAKALKFAQMMVFEDIKSAALGQDAITHKDIALKNLGIEIRTSSKNLAAAYDANEVAADQKYKTNGFVLLSGKVEGISKDVLGKPYVSLPGHKLFFGVQARFSEKESNALAALAKGQQVDLVCSVSSKIVTHVVLKDCQTFDIHAENIRSALNKSTEEALKGLKAVSANGAQAIAFSYATGEIIPEKVCDEWKSDKCESEVMVTVTKPENQILVKSRLEVIKATIKIHP